jgi:DNA polymerase V
VGSPCRTDTYARSITVPLRLPSSDTLRIVGAALAGLGQIFRPGFLYAKAGVMLLDLQPGGTMQQELDLGGHDLETDRRRQRLMQALDAVNDRWGKGTLRLGSTSLNSCRVAEPQLGSWEMRQERRSPRYTTRWGEVLTVC